MPNELKDGTRVFGKGEKPKIFSVATGEMGDLEAFKINSHGNYDLAVRSPFFSSLKPIRIRNVPRYLFKFKAWRDYYSMPRNGVYILHTSFEGRDGLRSMINFEDQKMVLHLKREVDILNAALEDIAVAIPLKRQSDLFKKLGEYLKILQSINAEVLGESYLNKLGESKFNEIFKAYGDLNQRIDSLGDVKEYNEMLKNQLMNGKGGVFSGF